MIFLCRTCSPRSSPAILALTASSKPLLCEAPARAVTLQASAIPWDSTKTTFKPVSDRIFHVNHRGIIQTAGNPPSLNIIYSFTSSAICICICQWACLHSHWALAKRVVLVIFFLNVTSKASKQHSAKLIEQPFEGGPWISLWRTISWWCQQLRE